MSKTGHPCALRATWRLTRHGQIRRPDGTGHARHPHWPELCGQPLKLTTNQRILHTPLLVLCDLSMQRRQANTKQICTPSSAALPSDFTCCHAGKHLSGRCDSWGRQDLPGQGRYPCAACWLAPCSSHSPGFPGGGWQLPACSRPQACACILPLLSSSEHMPMSLSMTVLCFALWQLSECMLCRLCAAAVCHIKDVTPESAS